MTSLFLESWITKYKMLHQATRPLQLNNPFFTRKENGEDEIGFLVTPPFSVVTNEEYKKIFLIETAKEAWTILQTTYEGTMAIKDSKL